MSLPQPSIRDLIATHYDSLYRYAYRLSGSATDAEDLTQEAFHKAMTRLRQLRDPSRAKSWLFRIVRNGYLHRVRNLKRQRTIPLDSALELACRDERLPIPVDAEQLQVALNELDESFRTPLILYYFEEFSYREIADHMDLPIGTVMSRLARAKGYLKQRLIARSPDLQHEMNLPHKEGPR